jgi:small subunit ribosomal protein S21
MSKHPKLVSVKVKNRDINKALKIFKRRVNDSAHLQELRERKYFEKPSLAKRKAKQQAKREQERETILAKIDDGNTKLQLKMRKKKRKKGKPNNQKKTNEQKGSYKLIS